MEMRKLSGEDLFPLLNIMAKVGVKDLIKGFYKQKSAAVKKVKEAKEKGEEVDIEDVGINSMAEITELVLVNMGRAKTDINNLLANLCNVKRAEIEGLSMSEYVRLVMDFLSQEEFKASLNVILSSFK